ncbi:ABC transporter permease [Desulfosporosinus fructosivorans]
MKKVLKLIDCLKGKKILIPILFVLVIPSICSLILGYQYISHVVTHVPTIIIDHDNSSSSKNLVTQIETNEAFNVVYYSSNDYEVENLIEEGKVATGIIIPENFSTDLLNGKAPKVLVIYDAVQMSMTGATKSRISEILGTIRSGYLMQIMQGKLEIMPELSQNYVQPMPYTTRYLGNPTKSTPNFMLPGMLLNIAQISIFILGVEIVEVRGKRYSSIWLKGIFCGLLGSISILISLMIQYYLFEMPFNGSLTGAALLTILYTIGMANLGMLIRLIVKVRLSAVKFAMSISATVMLAGYTFPVLAMPDTIKIIARYNPFTYYGGPLRDLTLLDINFQYVLPDIAWLIKFVILMWIATFVAYLFNNISVPNLIKRIRTLISRKAENV